MSYAQPFARATAIFAAIQACAHATFTAEQFKLAHTPYRSRGKGLGRHSGKKWGGYPTNWLRYGTGLREQARRQRQIEAGIIKVG